MMEVGPGGDRRRTVAVVGTGLMGAGIALVFASSGAEVALCGRDIMGSLRGVDRIRARLERLQTRGNSAGLQGSEILERIKPTLIDGPDLSRCGLAIEAVSEDRPTKNTVLRQLERVLGPDAFIASTTSGLPISGLARELRLPERFIGLHFFSPAERMALVEVVRGEETSGSTVEAALEWVLFAGKVAILVRDGPGFFATRIFAAYLDEGVGMLVDGVAPETIEAAARSAGRVLGPLATLDETGIDLNLQQARQAQADGLPERFLRPLSSGALTEMVAAGRRGRRKGGGFYDWPSSGKDRRIWAGLVDMFPRQRIQPDIEYVRRRLLAAEALESLRCLEEGVIDNADDADTATVLGLGFDAKLGGILRWAEAFGLAEFTRLCRELSRAHGSRFELSPWLQNLASGEAGLARYRRLGTMS